jgi:glycosyltransferase involved in cell wall biosynthesis
MHERKPRVSICIPVYNGANYLDEAIRSILEQTFADFELIIVDDCSTDGSLQIVRSFSDDRLRFKKNTEHSGLVKNWNKCIELSRTEYVYIFHQDDVMLPHNLEKKVEALDANPRMGLVFSQYYEIDANGNVVSKYPANESDRDRIQNGLKSFAKLFSGTNIICCPTVLARRECYEKLGGFDSRLPLTCDWEMWMRISLFYELGYVDEPLLKYRWHDGNETIKFMDNVKGLKQNFLAKSLILDKFSERIPRSKELRTTVKREHAHEAVSQASHHFAKDQHDVAKAFLRFSLELNPLIVTNYRFIRLAAKLALGEQGTKRLRQTKAILQGR